MIALTRVSKRFDGKRQVTALDSVDLAIARGEMVSLNRAARSLGRALARAR